MNGKRLYEETTTRDILRAARDLIAEPEHWTQRQFAGNKYNESVDVLDEHAVRFCAKGAVYAVVGRSQNEGCTSAMSLALRALVSQVPPAVAAIANDMDRVCPLAFFNDFGTHKGVIALYDRTIESVLLEHVAPTEKS